ncbi:hypothetical protein [Actinoplanes sp. NPDC049802]|uniref:hypothetical protein n=1 Tax=Actinoplanes sp. NPDC049802 TaxID=3154742 RepID=UPI00341106E8
MDDLNRMIAESMHDAAGDAPSDAGLLSTVHERSRRYRRRRLVTVTATAAAVAVTVAGIPFLTRFAGRPEPAVPPAASAPAPPVTPSSPVPGPSSASPAGSTPSRRTSSAPAAGKSTGLTTVNLISGWTAPVFPYTLPATDGMSAPVASMSDGAVTAFFEATELRDHADVTITVTTTRPAFTTSAKETPFEVRGHAGTLRTVDVSPAKQLTLHWKESPGRWIQLATDDTYTPEQVVALADSLTGASIPVQPPFDLDLSPHGLVADTVTASRMVFRSPSAAPGAGGFSTVLRKRQRLIAADRKVGRYDAALNRTEDEVTLSIDVTDWDATLQITVGNGLTVSITDLIRYAEGVHILNRSNPE